MSTPHFLHIHFLSIYFCSTPRVLEFFVTEILKIFIPKKIRNIKVTQKFQKSIVEKSQEFWSEFCSRRNSSTKKPSNIFRSGQNPKSCGTSKLPKNFENQFLKSPMSSGQSSVPPRNSSVKSPITFFS